ncbi:MAG: hypothetical protein SFW36_01265 [Leptolyngbyaceae cyanobacterium bins.59]|nr:hypothetical protein [Leptolyngbyaceae cyanobacterium bins.59]
MTTAVIEGLKTIPSIPSKGWRYLSINLALVNVEHGLSAAKKLGFSPELAQINYPMGSSEIHLLLWSGPIEDAPSDMHDRIDALADMVDSNAIRCVSSRH